MANEYPTDLISNIEQGQHVEVVPNPDSYQVVLLEFGQPNFDTQEIQTLISYNRAAYEKELAALPPVELPKQELHGAATQNWDTTKGFGFVSAVPLGENQPKRIFVHATSIKDAAGFTDVGRGDHPQMIYLDPKDIVPGDRPGQYKLDRARSQRSYEEEIERRNAEASRQRELAEKSLRQKLERAENTRFLQAHWEEIRALSCAAFSANTHSFMREEVPVENNSLGTDPLVLVLTQHHDASQPTELISFDQYTGAKHETHSALEIGLGVKGTAIASFASVRMPVHLVAEGWKGVRLHRQDSESIPADPLNRTLTVQYDFDFNRSLHRTASYHAEGKEPFVSVNWVTQPITTMTPLGEVTKTAIVYSPGSDSAVEVWGNFDISEQMRAADKAFLTGRKVSPELVDLYSSGELAKKIASLASVKEASELFNTIRAGSGELLQVNHIGDVEATIGDAIDLMSVVPKMLDASYDVAIKEKATKESRGYENSFSRRGDDDPDPYDITVRSLWIEVVARDNPEDKVKLEISHSDFMALDKAGVYAGYGPSPKIYTTNFLENRAALIEILLANRLEQADKTVAQAEKQSLGAVRRNLMAQEAALLSKCREHFNVEIQIEALQEQLLTKRVELNNNVEASMEDLRVRMNTLVNKGRTYFDSDLRLYEKIETTNEAARIVLPVATNAKRLLDEFRRYKEEEITFEEFRSAYVMEIGVANSDGVTPFERSMIAAENLISKYEQMEKDGYLVNYIVRPSRTGGSTTKSDTVIRADGSVQEPDFTVEQHKAPDWRRYDEVMPDTALVNYTSAQHGGQEPGFSMSLNIEVASGTITDAQLNTILDKFYEEHSSRLVAGDFTRESVTSQLQRVTKSSKEQVKPGEGLVIELDGRYYENGRRQTYNANVVGMPRDRTRSKYSYNNRETFPEFPGTPAPVSSDNSSEVVASDSAENYPTQLKFDANLRFVAEQDENVLLRQIKSPDGRYKGDVTLVEAAIVRLGETHNYTQLLKDGLTADTLSRGVKRLETLLKQGRETSPFQAELQQAHATLERKIIGMNTLYSADALIRDYVGADDESYSKVLTALAQRISDYEKDNGFDLTGFNAESTVEDIIDTLV